MIEALGYISPAARIGAGVEVGPYAVIHENAEVGAHSRIGSHCVIGEPGPSNDPGPAVIGPHSLIRSHSVVYADTLLGQQFETGHHVTVREGTRAGRNLRVGSAADLQGDLMIGDYVRIHSRVFIAKLAVLEDFVWLLPGVILTNDPHPPSDERYFAGVHVERFAVVAAGATILPGVRVGAGAVVGAGSVVTRDVKPGMLVVGSPARSVGDAAGVQLRGTDRPAYPWTTHFHRGYPGGLWE